MNGINIGRVGPTLVNEFLKDPNHVADFESFFCGRIFKKTYVDRINVSRDIETYESLILNNSGQRSARVNPGDPTPKGSYEWTTMNFKLQENRFAHPLPQTIFSSNSAMTAYLEENLRTKSGLRVKLDIENELLLIARNQGTAANFQAVTNVALTNNQRWSNYADPAHNPMRDLSDAMVTTGATKLLIGRDVAQALKFAPVFTGAAAGSGVTGLSDNDLLAKLYGIGFGEVHIAGVNMVNLRPFRQPAQTSQFHSKIAMMWSEDAITEYILEGEEFYYDLYDSRDEKVTYARAQQTSSLRIPYAQSVGTFTNILP